MTLDKQACIIRCISSSPAACIAESPPPWDSRRCSTPECHCAPRALSCRLPEPSIGCARFDTPRFVPSAEARATRGWGAPEPGEAGCMEGACWSPGPSKDGRKSPLLQSIMRDSCCSLCKTAQLLVLNVFHVLQGMGLRILLCKPDTERDGHEIYQT